MNGDIYPPPGQLRAKRIKDDGLSIPGIGLDREIDDDTSIGPAVDKGKAKWGYGSTTEAEYSLKIKGWHTFGSVGQGAIR